MTKVLKHIKKNGGPQALTVRRIDGERARSGGELEADGRLAAARPKEGSWLYAEAGSRCRCDPIDSSAPASDGARPANYDDLYRDVPNAHNMPFV